MVLRNLRVLRRVHRCTWPAEFWTEAGELNSLSKQQREALAGLNATLHVLPSPYAAWRTAFWEWRANLTVQWKQDTGVETRLQKYALKTVALLLSGCEECLLIDADNLMLQPPERLADWFKKHEAIFWPDLWDHASTATLWESMPPMKQKSQESGQLFVRKSRPEVKVALLLASLFAVRMDIFLGAIYEQQPGRLACGYGDKDTFLLAFRLLGVPYQLAAPLPSVLLDSRGHYVGLLQLDGGARPLFLHAAAAKGKDLGELLQDGLERCDFRSQVAARNVTCTAGSRGGSANVPVKKMSCEGLEFPSMGKVMAALEASA